MYSFGEVLRGLRKKHKLTQKELAKKLGMSFSTISMYERGEREPNFEIASDIANFFGVSMDHLLGKEKDNRPKFVSPQIADSFTVFPVIGEIAAGYNHMALEEWSGDTIEIPNSYLKGHNKDEFFVLKVKGSSMFPLYHDGDKVLILKQSTLNRSGDIGAILYDDECATLKKVEYSKGEDWMKLIPINPNYEPETIEGERLEHCRVMGVPRLLIRDID